MKSGLPFKQIIPDPASPSPEHTGARAYFSRKSLILLPLSVMCVSLSPLNPPRNLPPNPITSASSACEAQPSLCASTAIAVMRVLGPPHGSPVALQRVFPAPV